MQGIDPSFWPGKLDIVIMKPKDIRFTLLCHLCQHQTTNGQGQSHSCEITQELIVRISFASVVKHDTKVGQVVAVTDGVSRIADACIVITANVIPGQIITVPCHTSYVNIVILTLK